MLLSDSLQFGVQSAETKKTPSKTDRLDINSASAKDLKAIRGINETQAKKIIEGRPYKRRNELISEDHSAGDLRQD